MTLVVGVEVPDAQLTGTVGTDFAGVPQLLDDAGIGYVVLGADRAARPVPSLSPVLTGTLFARRTRGLGIVTAAAPQRDHPYNIARRVASLDHITGGRAGWLAVPTDHSIALGASDRGSWAAPATPGDADLLADAVTAARTLWRTWPIESFTNDALAQRPPDAEIRYADHVGAYATTGPLNVPTTPQGEPVVLWDNRFGDSTTAGSADVALVSSREHATIELPDTVAAHVRIDATAPEWRSQLAEAASGPATGALLRLNVADVPQFLDRTLPTLTGAGLIRLRTEPTTLRDHLGIARRADPDPRQLRPVFASA